MVYELRNKAGEVLEIVEAEAELEARLFGVRNVPGFHRALELPEGDQGLDESLRELEASRSMRPRLPVSTPSLPRAGQHGREVNEARRRLRDSWRSAHPEWTDRQVEIAVTGGRLSE